MFDFDNIMIHCSSNMRIFWKDERIGTRIKISYQNITMQFCKEGQVFMIYLVYARCNALDKLEL